VFSVDTFVGQDLHAIEHGAVLNLNVLSSAGQARDSNPLANSVLPPDYAAIDVGVGVHLCARQNRRVRDFSACGDLAVSTDNHRWSKDCTLLNNC
jgi:hypothetical protein